MTHIPDDLCALCGGHGLVPHRENCKIARLTDECERLTRQLAHDNTEWDAQHKRQWEKNERLAASLAAARAVLRHLRNRGPCPVCESEGECYPDCALDVVLRGEPAPSPAAAPPDHNDPEEILP